MGEAGPEAIMPLARGPDGKLGVRGAGGGGPTIVMNITTPDVQGFAAQSEPDRGADEPRIGPWKSQSISRNGELSICNFTR